MANEYSIIPCSEEESPSASESVELGNASASVVLRCAFVDRFALATDLLTNFRPWPKITSNLLVARNVSNIVGTNPVKVSNSQVFGYSQALVTVQYGILPIGSIPMREDPEEDPPYDIVTESITPRVEFRTLDHTKFRWNGGDALQRDEAPGIQVNRLDITRTYLGLRSAPANILGLVGKVNDSVITSIFSGISLTFEPETLLLRNFDPQTAYRNDGSSSTNLTLQFTWKEEGWNRFYRADTESFSAIGVPGSESPHESYTPDDLGVIFI